MSLRKIEVSKNFHPYNTSPANAEALHIAGQEVYSASSPEPVIGHLSPPTSIASIPNQGISGTAMSIYEIICLQTFLPQSTITGWEIPIPHVDLSIPVRRRSGANVVLPTVSNLLLHGHQSGDQEHDISETLHQLMCLRSQLGNIISKKKVVMRELLSREHQTYLLPVKVSKAFDTRPMYFAESEIHDPRLVSDGERLEFPVSMEWRVYFPSLSEYIWVWEIEVSPLGRIKYLGRPRKGGVAAEEEQTRTRGLWFLSRADLKKCGVIKENENEERSQQQSADEYAVPQVRKALTRWSPPPRATSVGNITTQAADCQKNGPSEAPARNHHPLCSKRSHTLQSDNHGSQDENMARKRMAVFYNRDCRYTH